MATTEDFVHLALRQQGKGYDFASEASPLDPDPDEFDCSELVEWALARLGVRFPDGSFNQWDAVHRMALSAGLRTRGALLFMGTHSRVHHVAISLGDGTTIEARGRRYGVGVWGAYGRPFDGAGLIPGLQYVPAGSRPPVNQGGGVGIRPGSSGEAIKFLELMLNYIRHHQGVPGIRVNGHYENQTKAAVKEFQLEWESIGPFHRLINLDLKKNLQVADPDTCRAIAVAVNFIAG